MFEFFSLLARTLQVIKKQAIEQMSLFECLQNEEENSKKLRVRVLTIDI
jgi:hypothetical protein